MSVLVVHYSQTLAKVYMHNSLHYDIPLKRSYVLGDIGLWLMK